MDDGGFMPDSTFGALSGAGMDLDFMDVLLDEGCWLKIADEVFSLQGSSTSSSLNDPSQNVPRLDSNINCLSMNPDKEIYHENPSLGNSKVEEHKETESQLQNAVGVMSSLVQSESSPVLGNGLSRSWWIGHGDNPGSSSSVKVRLACAIKQLQECTKDRNVLMQIWVPVKKGGKNVLTTIDQPYFLDPKCTSLARYRSVSKAYHFPAEEDSNEWFGLLGRVFLGKLPEWTPDVRFFRTEEYPRKNYAEQYNISGSLAVPVFEQGSGKCLGVVEVVTTTQKINYRPQLDNICKALNAVELRSAQDFCPPSVKACKEFCQAAVPEISEILGSVCRTHGLPIALTWAPCFRQGKSSCSHFDENYANCISTVDYAFFIADSALLGFHIACSEQYLFLGQGIVGRAFTTNKQCFATDITAFSKTDYPLSHQAMMFGLHAAIAIPLRSTTSGSADFVLELFLPKDCRDTDEQNRMWDLLPISIQQACRTLHIVTDKGSKEDTNLQTAAAASGTIKKEEAQKGKGVCVSWECSKQKSEEEFKVTTQWDKTQEDLCHKQIFRDFGLLQQTSGPKVSLRGGKDSSSAEHLESCGRKAGEKRRTKMEKTVSLQVLQQYFAGSLKDAAKSIGVCPTTLKRICRQHGITRWPSRKIKKVGHSLKKLQLVIDSVHDTGAAIPIGSFYTNFWDLTSPHLSGNGPFLPFQVNFNSKQSNPQPDGAIFNSQATASKSPSSSCSHSSGSSICCSTKTKQNATTNIALSNGDALVVGDPGSVLKRTFSDAELHTMNREELKHLARSQSHRTLGGHPSLETLAQPIPKSSGQSSRDAGGFRVKTTFGEDKTRFSLQQNRGFEDLQKEIGKRFNIDDITKMHLKYLDDDDEWVLLTCEADLEECKDVYRLSQSHTIKISLHQAPQPHLGRGPS